MRRNSDEYQVSVVSGSQNDFVFRKSQKPCDHHPMTPQEYWLSTLPLLEC